MPHQVQTNPSLKTITMTTTNTILAQLGGRQFIAMTNAKCFADGNTLVVKFSGCTKANIMYVTLEQNDTYTIKIAKYRNMDVSVKFEASNVYADQLQGIFTNVTGLYTHL